MSFRNAWPVLVAVACLGAVASAESTPLGALSETPDRPDSSAFLAVHATGSAFSLVPDESALRAQVREPLFAFVFTMVERDSLGSWTAADVVAFGERWGQASDFPIELYLESLTREPLPGGEVSHRDAACDRRWVIRLRPARIEVPMPYSILGYHPGSLSFQSPLELREWRLGERSIHVTVEGETRRYPARALTVFEFVQGWIVLDVDAWLDTLLGRAADDAVTDGFAVGWVDGRLVGVGTSVGRDGRRIFGELNFRTGEIENHGRPVARGLSQFSRGWTRTAGPDPREAWQAYGR